MKTVCEHLRARLLERAGLAEETKVSFLKLAELERSEWSHLFERLMRNRLIIGALRYGRIGVTGKPSYDRVQALISRAARYRETGNDELLVDVANLALLEFVEGKHPLKHFAAQDDGEHVRIIHEKR